MKILNTFNNYASWIYTVSIIALIVILTILLIKVVDILNSIKTINNTTNKAKEELNALSNKNNYIKETIKKAIPVSIKTFATYKIIKFISKHLFKKKNKQKENNTIDTISNIYNQGKTIKSIIDVASDIQKIVK